MAAARRIIDLITRCGAPSERSDTGKTLHVADNERPHDGSALRRLPRLWRPAGRARLAASVAERVRHAAHRRRSRRRATARSWSRPSSSRTSASTGTACASRGSRSPPPTACRTTTRRSARACSTATAARARGRCTPAGCVLPLQVTTVIWHHHSNAALGRPVATSSCAACPATVFNGGRSIEVYTGKQAIDVVADTPARALAAARALRPLNAPGSAQGPLPLPDYCPGFVGHQRRTSPSRATARAASTASTCSRVS